MRAKISTMTGFLLATGALCSSSLPTRSGSLPCVAHVESLDYPKVARAAHVVGNVDLRVRVDAGGHVGSVQVLAGPWPLAKDAEDNVKKWVFTPGEATSIEVRYEFRLEEPRSEESLTKAVFDLPSHVLVVARQRLIDVN
jgi:TonB family protein